MLSSCASLAPTVVDRLFFGRSIPNSTDVVTEAEWQRFVDEVVTPRFPAGLTIIAARGQWRGENGAIAAEPVYVLEIAHPRGAKMDVSLRAIAAEYKRRFRQEAVLRLTVPARMTFY